MTSSTWQPAASTRSVFESFAHLFAAEASGGPTTLVEAGPSWTLPPRGRIDGATVWGNVPAAGGSLRMAARWALGRERAAWGVRRRHDTLVRGVHRLPPAVRRSVVPSPARSLLLAGLIVELAPERHARVIDRVMEAAGARERQTPRLRPSRDGSALTTIRGADATTVELRIATIGGRKEPGRNADALATLHAHSIQPVPQLVGRGVTEGTSWTTETRLPGELPRRLDRALHREVVAFCTLLPRQPHATSLRDRMLALSDRYPRWGQLAGQLAERTTGPCGVLQHGDLWIGNLLVQRGRLTGVIDWDTWHPAGIPGVDLLQLTAMERRRRTGEDIGALWLGGLWKDPEFIDAARDYWRALGVSPTDDFLESLGLDWWAGQLFKRQAFAARPGWLEVNVDRVLEALGGSR